MGSLCRSVKRIRFGVWPLCLAACSPEPSVSTPAAAAGKTCHDSASALLSSVVFRPQEATKWCWAATGQMVMGDSPPQCEQVHRRTARDECACRESPSTKSGCNVTGWPQLAAYGFGYDCNRTDALSWSEIRNQLACKQTSFAFTWKWRSSGDYHIMVGVGFNTDPEVGEETVAYYDPSRYCEPGDPCLTYTVYEDYVEDDYHEHARTYYDIDKNTETSWYAEMFCGS